LAIQPPCRHPQKNLPLVRIRIKRLNGRALQPFLEARQFEHPSHTVARAHFPVELNKQFESFRIRVLIPSIRHAFILDRATPFSPRSTRTSRGLLRRAASMPSTGRSLSPTCDTAAALGAERAAEGPGPRH